MLPTIFSRKRLRSQTWPLRQNTRILDHNRCRKPKAVEWWFCSTTPHSHEQSYECCLSAWHDEGGQIIVVLSAKKMRKLLRPVARPHRIVTHAQRTTPLSSIPAWQYLLKKDLLVLINALLIQGLVMVRSHDRL